MVLLYESKNDVSKGILIKIPSMVDGIFSVIRRKMVYPYGDLMRH